MGDIARIAGRGVAAQRHDVTAAGFPIVTCDRIDFGTGRGDARQVRGRFQARPLPVPAPRGMGPLARRAARQLGRGACGESVFSYVSYSGGPESLKKKIKKQ